MSQSEKITYSPHIFMILFMFILCPRPSIAEAAKTGLPDYALNTGDI